MLTGGFGTKFEGPDHHSGSPARRGVWSVPIFAILTGLLPSQGCNCDPRQYSDRDIFQATHKSLSAFHPKARHAETKPSVPISSICLSTPHASIVRRKNPISSQRWAHRLSRCKIHCSSSSLCAVRHHRMSSSAKRLSLHVGVTELEPASTSHAYSWKSPTLTLTLAESSGQSNNAVLLYALK